MALDIVNLSKALKIVDKVIEGGADIIEVGTPLIKKYGILFIKMVRTEYPDVQILADSKTVDAGAIEAKVMFDAGADMMTVLGLASNATLTNSLDIAKKYEKTIVVDLINVDKVMERVTELYHLGLTNFCFHIGIDVQRERGVNILALLDEIKKTKATLNIRAFVAGGIKLKDLPLLLEVPIDVVVVGSAIVHSRDPLEATRKFKECIRRAKTDNTGKSLFP